jgi:hypothetical protein
MEVSGQERPGRFTPWERAPGTHCIGGWVGPRAGLDAVENRKFLTLPGLELWRQQIQFPKRRVFLLIIQNPDDGQSPKTQ